jgi:hypothetical protein
MIRHVPIIRARHLHDGIVACRKNPLVHILLQHDPAVRPRARHARRRRVAHAVVLGARVVDRVRHVEDALAVVHKDALAEVGEAACFSEGAGLEGDHVVGEFGVEGLACARVAPEEVVLSCGGVEERGGVDRLACGDGLVVEDHGRRLRGEGAFGGGGDGDADGLAVVGRVLPAEVEVVLSVTFDDGRGPGVAGGPGDVSVCTVEGEDGRGGSRPGHEVGRLPYVKDVATPAGDTICGRVDVVRVTKYGDVRISIKAWKDRASSLCQASLC